MKKMLFLLLLSVFLGFSACENEGPAEKAGEKIDETVEKAGDKLEQAGDKAGDTLEKAGDEVEKATD